MDIQRIAVLGAGMMGSGIAQVVLQSGFPVCLRDINGDFLAAAESRIQSNLARAVSKGKLQETEARACLERLTLCTGLDEALAEADMVIEAVPENLELKHQVFKEVDRLARPTAILASNTSELSISLLAQATSSRDRFIGTHWFYPAHIMKLIEVVRGRDTSAETLRVTLDFCARLGKETVVCKDAPGFITSRAISVLVAECLRIHEEGIASIADIDKAMRLGFNHPVGPLQMCDMSGLDVAFNALSGLSEAYGERFKPTEELAQLVKNKHLGQKTGKGIYHYKD